MCFLPAMVDDQTTLLFPSPGLTTLPLCAPYELICCTAAGPGGYALRVLLDTGTDPSAVDAGLVVIPEATRSQFEGAAVFGTSIVRSGEITARDGII